MGLFFQARSWRAPLQLIDCWLPAPSASGRDAHRNPSVTPRPTPSPTVQRFARAGWLGRPAANAPQLDDPTDPAGPATPAGEVAGGAARSAHTGVRRAGARVVLSGRMDLVCAELERLAAQEEALQRAA